MQLMQHLDIDDVQGRSIEHNARKTRARMELNCRVTHCGLPGVLGPNGFVGIAGFAEPNGCWFGCDPDPKGVAPPLGPKGVAPGPAPKVEGTDPPNGFVCGWTRGYAFRTQGR